MEVAVAQELGRGGVRAGSGRSSQSDLASSICSRRAFTAIVPGGDTDLFVGHDSSQVVPGAMEGRSDRNLRVHRRRAG